MQSHTQLFILLFCRITKYTYFCVSMSRHTLMKLRITAFPLLLLAALFIGCGGHSRNVTDKKVQGDVIVNDGNVNIAGKRVELQSGTKITQGAVLKINNL